MVIGVVGIAILMLVFVSALNFVLDEYAKGAFRTAVDEAAQAGATAGGSVATCQAEAAEVRADLLPGPFGDGVSIRCRLNGDEMVVSGRGSLPELVPTLPRVQISVLGLSLVEQGPGQ